MSEDPHMHLIQALETAYPNLRKGMNTRPQYLTMLRAAFPRHFENIPADTLPGDIAAAVQLWSEDRDLANWKQRLDGLAGAASARDSGLGYLQVCLEGRRAELQESLRELTLDILAAESHLNTDPLRNIKLDETMTLGELVQKAYHALGFHLGNEWIDSDWAYVNDIDQYGVAASQQGVVALVAEATGLTGDREAVQRLIEKEGKA